jgi:phage-related protein (TIGR01555 family)
MTTTHRLAPSGETQLAQVLSIESKRNDGWQNTLTGIGAFQRDKRMAMRHLVDAPLGMMELEGMYHGDDVVRRICELLPREMVREWIEIPGDPDNKLMAKVDDLGIRQAFHEAQTWARLYGGAVIILGVDDGQTMDKPLAIERVRSFDWITVLDRWDVQIHQRYADPNQANFDEPATYRVTTAAVSLPATGNATLEAIIHESRVLRFDGALTGRRRKRLNFNGWSQSVVDACYPVVRDFNQAFNGVSNLLTDFSQAVFKIKNLAQMLAADKDGLVVKRMQMLDMSRSVARAVMVDADGEEFTRDTISLAGVSDVLDRVAQRLSAATDYPMTLLMGESPAGMNATGESDHRFFYNVVKNEQETRFRAPLTKVLNILAPLTGVDASDEATGNVVFHFKSLWQESESDKEDTRLKVAQRDQIYYNMGALDASEIVVSRFGGDKYSTETMIDKDTPDTRSANADPTLTGDPDKAAANSADVQKTALNGAQVTALQGMLAAVGDGTLDPGAAKIAIALSFPEFPEVKINKMIDAIEVKEKKDPPPMIPGQAPGFSQKAPPVPVPEQK